MRKTTKAIAAAGLVSLLTVLPAQTTLAVGWVQNAHGWWFEFGDGNYPAANWYQTGGAWYYFDNEGYMVTGWREINGEWYFLSDSGAMVSNQWVGNYYLLGDGRMAKNQYIDGYWVGADGAWVPFQGNGGDESRGSRSSGSSNVIISSGGKVSSGGSSGGGSSSSGSSGNGSSNSSSSSKTEASDSSHSSEDESHTEEASKDETKPEETPKHEEEAAKAGWTLEDGDWYYYEDGERVRNRFISTNDGSRYYLGSSGKMLKNQTVNVNGKEYSLGTDGRATEMKAESTLSISEHTKIAIYTKGNDLKLDGVITSNYTIEKISISLNGYKKFESVLNPNAKRYDLSQVTIGSDQMSTLYGYLTGSARLEITAEDASGNKKKLLSYRFSLGKPVSLEADISGETKPSVINEGSNFGLRGVITSNYSMEKVEGKITDDEDGRNVVMNKVVYPNSTTYDLRGEINDALKFETLLPSTYYYIVTVTANGQETDVIHTSFRVKEASGSTSGNASDSGSGLNDAATYIRQDDSVSCTVSSVAMMIKRKALLDNNSNWGKVTLRKAKSAFWGSGGMAHSGTYDSDGVRYRVGSDDPIKNSVYGAQSAGEKRYQHIADMLSNHPEGIVAYFYDYGVNSKQHAVLVTAVKDGTIYCLDPASGEGKSIPLASVSTFRSSRHFGLTSQDAILRLDNTRDGRMYLWYID